MAQPKHTMGNKKTENTPFAAIHDAAQFEVQNNDFWLATIPLDSSKLSCFEKCFKVSILKRLLETNIDVFSLGVREDNLIFD